MHACCVAVPIVLRRLPVRDQDDDVLSGRPSTPTAPVEHVVGLVEASWSVRLPERKWDSVDAGSVDGRQSLVVAEIVDDSGVRLEADDPDVVEVDADLDGLLDDAPQEAVDHLGVVHARRLLLQDTARRVHQEHDVQQTVACEETCT